MVVLTGEAFLRFINRKGHTRMSAAKEIGVSPSTIGHYVNGFGISDNTRRLIALWYSKAIELPDATDEHD